MFLKSKSEEKKQKETIASVSCIDEKERKYRVLVDLCYELIRRHDYQKALIFSQSAKSIDPEGSDPYCIEAQVLLSDQKYAEALKKINYAIELNPDDEYLVEIKEGILLKTSQLSPRQGLNETIFEEDDPIEGLITHLTNIENAIKSNNLKKSSFKRTEQELTKFFKNTKKFDDSIVRLYAHKIALAFVEKAQLGNPDSDYVYYKKALTYYLFSSSSFHIAAAYHNLATLKEKSQRQISPAIKCEKIINLYKQALYWYQNAIDQIKQNSFSHNYQAFLPTLEKYSNDVLNDIDQLEEIQRRDLVCA